jgi:23S rRNA pseudouridine1911/1915/1917 synthase
VQKLIKANKISVNKKNPKKAGDKVNAGSIIEVKDIKKTSEIFKDEKEVSLKKKDDLFGKIDIVFENKDYVVLNKPSGLLVHPTQAGETNTLVHWLTEKYPQVKKVGQDGRWGIVHRLDKETSGLLVVALSSEMFELLKEQFKKRKVKKEYIALVHGKVEEKAGKIDFDIARGTSGKMVARPKIDELKLKNVGKKQAGKKAITVFEVVKKYSRFTLLNVKILTGRTHQIRVHCFAIDHALAGDNLYYNKKNRYKKKDNLHRIFLHSAKLGFTDLAGKKVYYTSQLPDELKNILKDLK